MHRANGVTRREILHFIKTHGSATVEKLSKALGISAVAVRQHLAALDSEGQLLTHIERQGMGRPAYVFRLSDSGDETFPRGYDELANDLLDELRSTQGDAAVDSLFAARRARLQTLALRRTEGTSVADRVAALARLQNELGYMAGTQEDGDDLLLVERNCAICRIARKHREACAHELRLFQDVAGDTVRVEREKYILDGDPVCLYRIRRVAAPSE